MFEIEKFRNRLFTIRNIELKISRDLVQKQSGINQNMIHHIEDGTLVNPKIQHILKICDWMKEPITNFIK